MSPNQRTLVSVSKFGHFELLVNAQHIKNVPGRKTDVKVWSVVGSEDSTHPTD